MHRDKHPPELDRGLIPAAEGVGPLVQRDYWAAISACRASPNAVMRDVAGRFSQYSPADLVVFGATGGHAELTLGDELDVDIRGSGPCRVRVVHKDRCSLTLATIAGHPEAGRITFGAYANPNGDVVFHIRSRARSSSPLNYAGFMAVGEPMQTSTWTEFVNTVALTHGRGVVGDIHAETRTIDEEEDPSGPTFIAQEH